MADLTINGQDYYLTEHTGDAYREAPVEMQFTDAERRVIRGHVERCGITRPGYPDRATYRVVLSFERPQPGIYVYDNGRLHEVNQWHADQRREDVEHHTHRAHPVVRTTRGGTP